MAIRTAVNRALTAITALPTAAALVDGNLTLLTTATASSSATLDFTSGIDSTYDSYVFKFYNIHPATDSVDFEFQADTGTNTNYNQTITSTTFRATHDEAGSSTDLGYRTSEDQANGTAFQDLNIGMGNDNDQSLNGTLQIFSPSSSTFVKHFIARIASPKNNDYHVDWFCAGYFNTTTALTRVQFKFASGNIDAGIIKMYGVGDKQS